MQESYSPGCAHVIVMYHYVESPSQKRAGIHPLPPDEFERQVAFLSANYTIATPLQVYEAARSRSSERMAAFTFDDGLRDNYDIAAPILERYNVRGSFFPIGMALGGEIPFTHKIHILLSFADAETIASFITASRRDLPIPAFPTDALINPRRRYDTIITANIKDYTLLLEPAVRTELMEHLFTTLGIPQEQFLEELFMTPEQLRNLVARGHSVGSHSFTHESLEHMDSWIEDIRKAQTCIHDSVGVLPETLVYPYGQAPQDVAERERELHEAGIRLCLTTEARDVKDDDSPVRVPRFDCNMIRDFLVSREA